MERFADLLYVGIVVFAASSMASGNAADSFFDDTYVHEIRLTFDSPDWYSTLYNSHANDAEDPYFPASFTCDGKTLEKIGVRMKGNSSFRIQSDKKSLKLDFDEYDEDNDELSFFGLKKLNLNNGAKDPTMLREKLFLDFAGKYIPTIRCVHVRMYVNDEYFGLYSAVEQVDKAFIQDRLGRDEDGNLYKGAARDGPGGPRTDFGSDLAWEGADVRSYYDHYQLKTNEEENDYSGLVDMIDVLNNADPASFAEVLEPLMDVENVLTGLALNSLFSNHDSYNGSAHNYYIYQSNVTQQFSHILWDTNESFGTFSMFAGESDMRKLDPFWLPFRVQQPLMEKLWENDAYARQYLACHAMMLREGFDEETMTARINQLADLIRTDVYADHNKPYSNAAFEQNLSSTYEGLYGLKDFVSQRADFLKGVLNTYVEQADLRINEIVAQNDANFVDAFGDRDPWIELYNSGVGKVSLSGLYLTDVEGDSQKWALPDVAVEDGQHCVIWLDSETGEGSDHASFSLSAEGGSVYLYDNSGRLLDQVYYPAVGAGISYQRYPDGDDNWIQSDQSTPDDMNRRGATPSVQLFINEILADNDTVLQDPDEQDYPDWIELYNPNAFTVDLGGMYFSDDAEDPLQWRIPEGVTIAGGGFLIFWADKDEDQGPTHMNFKLSSSGEELVLYDSDNYGNVLIDHVVFGAQTADVSYGRSSNGAEVLAFFESPTPGTSNKGSADFSLLGYPGSVVNDQKWVDTGDLLGWLEVTCQPWVWNALWSNWIYVDESLSGVHGIWIWMMGDSAVDHAVIGEDLYLGYAVQKINDARWIDTGSWLGWLEISDAPWVWSARSSTGFLIIPSADPNDGIWIYLFP